MRTAAARGALLVLAVVGVVLAAGAPRLTWRNTGWRVDHPPVQAASALAGAAAVVAASLGSRPRVAVAGIAAAALVALAAQRVAWSVEAAEAGLVERGVSGASRIAWGEIEAVEPGAQAIRVRARNGSTITLGTGGLAPEDRTRVERTIARRVREAAR